MREYQQSKEVSGFSKNPKPPWTADVEENVEDVVEEGCMRRTSWRRS